MFLFIRRLRRYVGNIEPPHLFYNRKNFFSPFFYYSHHKDREALYFFFFFVADLRKEVKILHIYIRLTVARHEEHTFFTYRTSTLEHWPARGVFLDIVTRNLK